MSNDNDCVTDPSILCRFLGNFNKSIYLLRRGGSVLSASDLGPEGQEFEPWPVHPRCVLRQNTYDEQNIIDDDAYITMA